MQRRSPESVENHRSAATLHAIRRARLRLGVMLSETDVLSHGLTIWAGHGKLLGRGGGGRQLQLVVQHGREFLAVWDGSINRVVTYLGSISEWKGGLTPAGRSLLNRYNCIPATDQDDGRSRHRAGAV